MWKFIENNHLQPTNRQKWHTSHQTFHNLCRWFYKKINNSARSSHRSAEQFNDTHTYTLRTLINHTLKKNHLFLGCNSTNSIKYSGRRYRTLKRRDWKWKSKTTMAVGGGKNENGVNSNAQPYSALRMAFNEATFIIQLNLSSQPAAAPPNGGNLAENTYSMTEKIKIIILIRTINHNFSYLIFWFSKLDCVFNGITKPSMKQQTIFTRSKITVIIFARRKKKSKKSFQNLINFNTVFISF